MWKATEIWRFWRYPCQVTSRLFVWPLVGLASCVLSAGSGGGTEDSGAADSMADARSTDASPTCRGVDADVVAYLALEGPGVDGVWPDQLGRHNANALPTQAPVTPGPSGCGNAFDASGGRYLVIENNASFDLAQGSIEIYARVPLPGDEDIGIVSRDREGNGLGHLDVVFNPTNQVVVRLQDEPDLVQEFRCSTPQIEGDWIEISINFGVPDLELFINGVAAVEAGALYVGVAQTCGGQTALGLGSHDDPWVLGASLRNSLTPGEPVTIPLGTAVDEFRLSNARRSF